MWGWVKYKAIKSNQQPSGHADKLRLPLSTFLGHSSAYGSTVEGQRGQNMTRPMISG